MTNEERLHAMLKSAAGEGYDAGAKDGYAAGVRSVIKEAMVRTVESGTAMLEEARSIYHVAAERELRMIGWTEERAHALVERIEIAVHDGLADKSRQRLDALAATLGDRPEREAQDLRDFIALGHQTLSRSDEPIH